ncbi:MAG: NAD-dependent epimerase/dehydratase family protein [Proteobacteria bacterium]|nr:NAD-dependent epimerase/dehydratase family protein [Pseudomonadota bacterium]
MKALITGATGLIGSGLCQRLKEQGWWVRALVLPGDDTGRIDALVDEKRSGDVTAPDTLAGIGEGIDVVYHLAARVLDYGRKRQFYASILDGTRHMLEACAGRAGRFVYASSIAAMGVDRHLKGLTERDPGHKTGVPYNDAKLDAEGVVNAFNDRFPRGVVIVRPSNVTGPGSVWVSELLRQFLKSRVPLVDQGRHSSAFIYIDNLLDGLVLAGTVDRAAGQTYFLRDDWDVTWQRYMTDLSALVGKAPRGNLSFRTAWRLGALCEAICRPFGWRPPVTRLGAALTGHDNDVDTTKAQTELGWRTRVTYEEAMSRIKVWISRT